MYTNQSSNSQIINNYLSGVFVWMTKALLLTLSVAVLVAVTPLSNLILGNRFIFIALIVFELYYVINLTKNINEMSLQKATSSLMIYALLNGLTLSFIFFVYSPLAIIKAFLITAILFIIMSVIGKTTKFNLTNYSSYFFYALIGIILSLIINLFIMSSIIDLITCIIGVIVFLGLTAYDVQKLSFRAISNQNNPELLKKQAILGALELYLDFVNILLFILRISRR